MAVLGWIRFLAGGALLLLGLGIFVIEMIGVFRFRYVLNRMPAFKTFLPPGVLILALKP